MFRRFKRFLAVEIDLAYVDLSQMYTSVSRARALEGLSIIAIDWSRLMTNQKVRNF